MWIRTCLILHNLIIRIELAHGQNLAQKATWTHAMNNLNVPGHSHSWANPNDNLAEVQLGSNELDGTVEGRER